MVVETWDNRKKELEVVANSEALKIQKQKQIWLELSIILFECDKILNLDKSTDIKYCKIINKINN